MLLAATVGPGTIVAALVLYTLIQQVENNFLVPKIQGDAVELHPAVVMFAIIVGGSLAGLARGDPRAARSRPPSATSIRYLFRRLSPDEPEALVARPLEASALSPTMPEPIDAYKVLQVDPEAEDEVIQAAYRRLARKYHPDLAFGPEAAARMAAINAAWGLIGEPGGAAAYDRARALAGAAAGGHAGAGRAGRTRPARPAALRPAATGSIGASGRDRPPETVSRDWTSGRSTQGGGFDESMRAADGLGAAGPPPGQAVGQRPDVRSLQRLVARRDRAPGHRVHRVARPDADRSGVSRGDRRDPAGDRSAAVGRGRIDRPTGPVPPPLTGAPSPEAAAARSRPWDGTRMTGWPVRDPSRPVARSWRCSWRCP